MSEKESIVAIYDRLKLLCKEKGITQTELCNSCGINVQSHRGRITKKVAPDIFDTVKIAQYLNTTVEYLITGQKYKVQNDIQKNMQSDLIALSTENQKLKDKIDKALEVLN